MDDSSSTDRVRPTYIVGHDGSDASRAALRFATALAEAAGGDVVAAHVYPWTTRSYAKGASDGPVAALDEQSRADAAQMLTDEGVPVAMQHVMGGGSPTEGLQRLVESRQTALVVVGVTHRGALGRIVPGGVADHLLHGSPCPVAVVPADAADTPIQTVVVAYDDSREARAALQVGTALARRLDARLRIVGVSQAGLSFVAPMGVPYLVEEHGGDDEDRLRVRLTSIADRLPSDLQVDVRVHSGSVAPALVTACADGVDLLVIGSRGYGPSRSVLLGSVSRHVVDHAPCPVIVVPRTASPDVLAEVEADFEHGPPLA